MATSPIPSTPNFPLIDYHGSMWKLIEDHLKRDLDITIKALVGDKTHDESQKLRGKIHSIQQILNWKDKEATARRSNSE